MEQTSSQDDVDAQQVMRPSYDGFLRGLRPAILTTTSDWNAWKFKFLTFAEAYDVQDLFGDEAVPLSEASSKQEQARHKKARLMLVVCLGDDLHPLIHSVDVEDNKKSPIPIWRVLKQHYNADDTAAIRSLRDELQALRMGPNMSLIRLIYEIDTKAARINNKPGHSCSEHEKVGILMRGMHPAMGGLVDKLEIDNTSTWAQCCIAAKSYHRRKGLGDPNDPIQVDDDSVPGGVRAMFSVKEDNTNGKSNRTCNYCKKVGHLERDCRRKQRDNKKRNVECYKCGKKGHYQRDCNQDQAANVAEGEEDVGYAFVAEVEEEDEEEEDICEHFNNVPSDFFDSVENGAACAATTPIGKPAVDSGATRHFVNSTEGVLGFKPAKGKVSTAKKGVSMPITGKGTLPPWGVVTVVPTLRTSLLSTKQLYRDHGYSTTLTDVAIIKDRDGNTVAEGMVHESGLYVIDRINTTTVPDAVVPEAHTAGERNTAQEWHVRLGHLSLTGIRALVQNGDLTDINPEDLKQALDTCPACIQGKMTKTPFPKEATRRATRKLELVHTDVSGKMSVPSGKDLYFIAFIDDCTRKSKVYLMEGKYQALEMYKRYIQETATPEGLKVGTLRSDEGGEYIGEDFRGFCLDQGTKREITARHSPSQNGVAERYMRTLVEMARSMLAHRGLDKEWWGPAVLYAAYIRNRSPTKALGMKTPYEMWTGSKADYSRFQVFGAQAYVYVPDLLRTKLDMKAEKGMFVGLDEGRKCYKVYVQSKRRVLYSRDVTFLTDADDGGHDILDHTPPSAPAHPGLPLKMPAAPVSRAEGRIKPAGGLSKVVEGRNKVKTTKAKVKSKVNNSPTYTDHKGAAADRAAADQGAAADRAAADRAAADRAAAEQGAAAERTQYVTRAGRSIKPTSKALFAVEEQDDEDQGEVAFAMMITDEEQELRKACDVPTDEEQELRKACDVPTPSTHHEARTGPDREQWRAAEHAELRAHKENNTATVTKLTPGAQEIKTRWLYNVKEAIDGYVDKQKARWIAKGYEQTQGVNYTDTYAPVARMTSIRTFLSTAVSEGWDVHQMDVSTAFLYGAVDEDIYVKPPPGYSVPEGYTLKLNKALYGLKQAPRVWHGTLHKHLSDCGFKPSDSDPCIYIKTDEEGVPVCVVAVFVDDLLIASGTLRAIQAVKDQFKNRFRMTDMGTLEWYLGMRITRHMDGTELWLTQDLYTTNVLKKYGMTNCNPVQTPMLTGANLTKEQCPADGSEEQERMKTVPYRSMIGSLLYLSICSRPDISLAVSKLARFVSNPGSEHYTAVKRVMRYLRGTITYGLYYVKGDGILRGFSDASWGDADNDRKSTTGFLFKHGSNLISWATYGQTSTARSTVEAEYMALSDAAQEATWLRRLCNELGGQQQEQATLIYEDNQGCMAMAANPVGHRRMKHIDIRYHYLREVVQKGQVKLKYCPTAKMTADILTKALGGTLFERHRAELPVQKLE